jgi:uncharacterized membrane protein YkgB
MNTVRIDSHILHVLKVLSEPLSRIGLFVVFFWFGFIKVIGLSPAEGLVIELLDSVFALQSTAFVVGLGVFECIVGILFLVKGAERIVLPLLFVHMLTTFGPLIFLPELSWQGIMVPTLEGQYIIKNLLIIAVAVTVAARLHPIHKSLSKHGHKIT